MAKFLSAHAEMNLVYAMRDNFQVYFAMKYEVVAFMERSFTGNGFWVCVCFSLLFS